MSKRPIAAALGTVLIVLMLAFALIFVVAGTGISDLRLSVAVDQRANARNLADSAISIALAEVSKNESFGLGGEIVTAPIPDFLPTDSVGVVAFNPGTASGLGVPVSTNGIGSTLPQNAPDGAVVPAYCVRLVGLGRVGEVEYRSECVFFRPPVQNGIIGTGKVTASDLFLAGVQDATAYTGSWSSTADEEKRDANLFSNFEDDTENSIRLLGDSNFISGNASSQGRIAVDAGSFVKGDVRERVAPLEAPQFDLDRMAQDVANAVGAWPFPPSGGDVEVVGLRYFNGPQTFSGAVNLDGVIVADGPLDFFGEVRGEGAIISLDQIRLRGGSSLETDKALAVAAKKDIVVDGSDKDTSYFRGLLYSEGDITATDITILGTVIANSEEEDQGNIELRRVNLIQTDVSISYSAGVPIWGSYAGDDVVEFEERDEQDGCWIVQVSARKEAGKTVYDLRMYMNNAASDFTDPPSNYPDGPNDGRGRVFFSGPNIVGRNYHEAEGLTRAELIDKVKEIFIHPSYWTIFGNRFEDYLDSLTSRLPDEPVLSFNLNNVLYPVESSKILLWRDYQRP